MSGACDGNGDGATVNHMCPKTHSILTQRFGKHDQLAITGYTGHNTKLHPGNDTNASLHTFTRVL